MTGWLLVVFGTDTFQNSNSIKELSRLMECQLPHNNYGIKVRDFPFCFSPHYHCRHQTLSVYIASLRLDSRAPQHFSFPTFSDPIQPHILQSRTQLINTCPHSRFGSSQLHQRDPRSALFENYNGGANNTRAASSSPSTQGGGYGAGYGYTGGANGSAGLGAGMGEKANYRPATPNSRYVGMEGSPMALRMRMDC